MDHLVRDSEPNCSQSQRILGMFSRKRRDVKPLLNWKVKFFILKLLTWWYTTGCVVVAAFLKSGVGSIQKRETSRETRSQLADALRICIFPQLPQFSMLRLSGKWRFSYSSSTRNLYRQYSSKTIIQGLSCFLLPID